MNLPKGPRTAFTHSKPMPIRTRRMVQIARLVNGLSVPDALQQLRFCNKFSNTYCFFAYKNCRVNLSITNNPKGGLFRPFRRAFTCCTI